MKTQTRGWALAAIGATLALGLGLTAVTPANAEVNENDHVNQEPNFQPTGAATAVYSLRLVQSNANALVTVNGASMSNGGKVDTWVPTTATYGQGSILQANQLWEFVPAPDNAGKAITTGYGWLRNRQSGLCLEVNGASTSEGATVDQWDCLPGHDNEMWKAVPTFDGSTVLRVRHSGAFLAINEINCAAGAATSNRPAGNGQALTVSSSWACGYFSITRANYAYATNRVTVPLHAEIVDSASYGCMSGWAMRAKGDSVPAPGMSVLLQAAGSSNNLWYYHENLSSYATKLTPSTSDKLTYTHNDWFTDNPLEQTGQTRLFCFAG